MKLEELIDQFLELSQRIADAIHADEEIEEIRMMDEHLNAVFQKIIDYNASLESEKQAKSHFLIGQIVKTDDFERRKKLAEYLKDLL